MSTNTIILILFLFSSCTISFQNISTHGKATDLVDDQMSNEPDFSPTLTIPKLPL